MLWKITSVIQKIAAREAFQWKVLFSFLHPRQISHKASTEALLKCFSCDLWPLLSNCHFLRFHCTPYFFAGVKFYCRNCGREGHRRNYCPEVHDKLIDKRFRCRLCGRKGHNRRTCPRSQSNDQKNSVPRNHQCKICGQSGHNSRTCPQLTSQTDVESNAAAAAKKVPIVSRRRTCTCHLCHETGHNIRTCPRRNWLLGERHCSPSHCGLSLIFYCACACYKQLYFPEFFDHPCGMIE